MQVSLFHLSDIGWYESAVRQMKGAGPATIHFVCTDKAVGKRIPLSGQGSVAGALGADSFELISFYGAFEQSDDVAVSALKSSYLYLPSTFRKSVG